MAQAGLMLTDEARTMSVLNDSGTTAITAGDIVYSIANDDMFGSTISAMRAAYAASDVKVKAAHWANTSYKTIMGVAIQDIALDGYGSIALEGVFLHQAQENVEAGQAVQFYEGTAQKLQANDAGATAGYDASQTKIGRALTGGSADKKIILWKLTL